MFNDMDMDMDMVDMVAILKKYVILNIFIYIYLSKHILYGYMVHPCKAYLTFTLLLPKGCWDFYSDVNV